MTPCVLQQRPTSSSSSSSSKKTKTRAMTTTTATTSSSFSFQNYYYLLLLCLLLFWSDLHPTSTIVVNAYVVLSREPTSYAVDALLDETSRKLVNTGVLFRDGHEEVTAAGQADTQCIMSIGDIRGFDRNVHESPQFCVSLANFPASSGITYGIVAGIAGTQATLYRMDFLGDYDDAPLLDPFHLPIDTFPVDMATDANGGVYVGLHDTDGQLVRPGGKPLEEVLHYIDAMTNPEFSPPVISPLVMKVNITTGTVVWQTEFTTTSGQSLIGATIHLPSRNILLVVGSTYGNGQTVGGDDGSTVDDWDGYVTKLDASTGNLVTTTTTTASSTLRVGSQPGLDDFIYGVCASQDDIYIVGSSNGAFSDDNDNNDENEEGSNSGGAFVVKIDIDTLEIIWKKQITGTGEDAHLVSASKCAVRGGTLYVAGEVPSGVLMEQDDARTAPSPNQDLLAFTMDVETAEIIWVRQIDSRRHDYLCNILIAANGDLFVMGNAADFDNEKNDVYFMTVSRQGGAHDWLGLPDDADPIYGYIAGAGDDDDGSTNREVDDTVQEDDDKDNKTTIIIVAVVVPAVLLLFVIIYGVVTAKGNDDPEIKAHNERHNKTSSMTTESHTGDGTMMT